VSGPAHCCIPVRRNGAEEPCGNEVMGSTPHPAVCQRHAEQLRGWFDRERERFAEVRLVEHLEAERQRLTGGVVYFIRQGDFVKIGTSRQLDKRLSTLRQEWGDFEYLGSIPGGFKREQKLHRRFAQLRVLGEWFEASPELLAFIAEQLDATSGQAARP